MAPKPKRPDYQGSLASYKQSVADKPKNLDLPSPSDVVNWASGIVASGRTASGQTQPLTPGDQGLRTLGQGISLANTYLNPYANTTRKALGAAVNRDRQSLTALSKSAAVDALVTGAGYGAGKIVGKLASSLANKPMYYGISGRTQSGLSKLTPQIGENVKSFNTNIANMFGENQIITTPKVFSYKPEIQNVLPVTDYAQMAGQGTGSAYVVKTPAKNITSNIIDTSKAASAMDAFAAKGLAAEQMSNKGMKVVKEFPMGNYTKRTYDTMEAAWETSQNFSPLAGQISRAIQADKKLQSSIITNMVNTGGKIGAATAVVSKNKKDTKKK